MSDDVQRLHEVKSLRRENRELRKFLLSLTTTTADCIAALDAEMYKASDIERGKRIAAISNILEYANDSAMHFGCKLDFPAMKRLKNRLPAIRAANNGKRSR